MTRFRWIGALGTAIAAFAGLTCGDGVTPPNDQTPTSLTISGGSEVVTGGTLQLAAEAKNATGMTVTATITWSSDNVDIATVDNTGTVRGVAPGTVSIQAATPGASGTITATQGLAVVQREVAVVAVSPPSVSILDTLMTQLTAMPRDADGNAAPGVAVSWGTSDPTVATVDNTGLVTGVVAGTAIITATADTASGTASVTVSVPTLSLHVQPTFTARCALSGCHAGSSPAEGMNLSAGLAFANTVNVQSNQSALPRIRPFEPDSSYLVHKIQGTQASVGGTGSQMPLTGCCLSQPQIDTIRAWVKRGAQNN